MLGQVLQPGHDVLIDDGLVRLRVQAVDQGKARCAVVVGGLVAEHKGVNVPGAPVPIPSLTRKDAEDLEFALDLDVDFVALSFVRSAADVRDLKGLIEQAGSPAHVIAKIEKAEAVDALLPILDETDAVMVARGDLGVEIGAEVVPLLQKRIIKASLDRGKPVITATQMLESMLHQPEPTRAEASDIANAILDGTSAVMLSEETAIGEYPLESVRTMDRIAKVIEPSIEYRHQFPQPGDEPSVNQAMSNAACDLAEALGAKAILVPTFSGRTASVVARLRPRRPVIGLSHHDYALRHMALEWGVTPIRMPEAADVEELWASSLESGKRTGPARCGRPRRSDCGDRGQHPRHHRHDQAGVRVTRLGRSARTGPEVGAHAEVEAAFVTVPETNTHHALGRRRDPRGRRAPLLPPAPQLRRDPELGAGAPRRSA